MGAWPPRSTAEPASDAAPLTPDPIMELGIGFWASKTLLSAVELGLFSALAEAGPLDADELRERLGLHPRSARDFFDALVALEMLERDDGGRYANTPATDLFLDRAKPSYVGGILEMSERAAVSVLGLAHRRPADRSAAERGEGAAATSSRPSMPTRTAWRSSRRR